MRTIQLIAALSGCVIGHAAWAGEKPKACPKGYIAFGTISKIEISKRGIVTESVRMKDGSEQRMPSFKPVKAYENQEGHAFCVDAKPESN